jgi:hypothetical protein
MRCVRREFDFNVATMTNTCVADYIEDICPYATFQLSKPPYSESTYSGNVYSGPYHSVRGSFVYHDPKPAGAESYKFRQVLADNSLTMIFNTANSLSRSNGIDLYFGGAQFKLQQ